MNQYGFISRMCFYVENKRQGTKEQVHSVTNPGLWTFQSIEIDEAR